MCPSFENKCLIDVQPFLFLSSFSSFFIFSPSLLLCLVFNQRWVISQLLNCVLSIFNVIYFKLIRNSFVNWIFTEILWNSWRILEVAVPWKISWTSWNLEFCGDSIFTDFLEFIEILRIALDSINSEIHYSPNYLQISRKKSSSFKSWRNLAKIYLGQFPNHLKVTPKRILIECRMISNDCQRIS